MNTIILIALALIAGYTISRRAMVTEMKRQIAGQPTGVGRANYWLVILASVAVLVILSMLGLL